MRRPVLASALLALSLLVAPRFAGASPVLLTFEDLSVGTVLGAQYAALGVTFAPNAFSGPGGPTGTWGTNTNMQIVASGGADVGGLGTPALVSGNILRSFNGWLNENGDPSFVAQFVGGIDSFSATFAGIAATSSTRIIAFNGAVQVGSATASSTGQQILSITAPLITSVVVLPGDFFDWVGVDNIQFNTVNATAVPEPGSMVLLGSGVLGVFAIARKRRSARQQKS